MSIAVRVLSALVIAGASVLSVAGTAQATPTTVTTLTGFHATSGAAFSHDGERVFVVQDNDGSFGGESSVVVLDARTLTRIGDAIPSGVNGAGALHSIAVSPDGTKAYVSLGSGIVKPFSPATLTFGPAITVGTAGIGQIAFTPDGTKAYVAVNDNGNGQYVKVIDVSNDAVTNTISACGGPSGIAMAPDGLKVFVNCSDGSLSVIETTGDTLVTNVTPTGHLQGTTITMAPDGSRVYVTAFAIPSTVTTVMNTSTYAEVHQFTNEPKDVSFNSDGSAAFIMSASSGDLIPTDPVTFAAGTPISVTSPEPGGWFLTDKNPRADQYVITGNSQGIVYVVGGLPALPDTGASAPLVAWSSVTAVALMGAGLGAVVMARRRQRA